jgi:hypothetical protein
MKKDELIKKAAERGITLDETQAEKYINLSDEELENLEISGGCEKNEYSYCKGNVHGTKVSKEACAHCMDYRKEKVSDNRFGDVEYAYICNTTGWEVYREINDPQTGFVK